MKKDKHKTDVIFYKDESFERFFDEEILAYFPNKNYDLEGKLKTCYAHIGQHSACSPEYVKELSEATKDEYEALKCELEGLGYNLRILNK